MNPDTYSITFLLGAGMIADLCEWVGIALVMLGCSFSLGMWLGWLRKRRIAKIQASYAAMKNFEHFVPLVPACEVAQDCNGCFHCPDLQPPVMKLDV